MRALIWLVLAACVALMGTGASAGAPSVAFTSVPAYGTWGSVSGLVSGVSPAGHRVALFIYVPGLGWYTKPTYAQAATPIQPDGTFSASVATGGIDNLATKVRAYLIPSSCDPCCASGQSSVPPQVEQCALAVAWVNRQDPGARRISLGGLDWVVKASTSPVGPGPNIFSDSAENVWVDTQGRLHLKITYTGGQWQCAEVFSERTLGYGSYRFYLDSPVDNLDPNSVLGLFTWSDDGAYTNREIDIEFSRWTDPNESNQGQFVVQPYSTSGNRHRFAMPPAVPTTHCFSWQPERVRFQSVKGTDPLAPSPPEVIQTWTMSASERVPRTLDEQVRLNLWLANGSAPANGQPVEVIISRFEFVPPVICIGGRDFSGLLAAAVKDRYAFRVWGMVTRLDARSFLLDDASGLPIRVAAEGHGLLTGDYAWAEGRMDASTQPPSLNAMPPGAIRRVN